MQSTRACVLVVAALAAVFVVSAPAHAEVRAWEGKVTIPTYSWEEDVNPKFWALEGGAKLSTTIQGAITYPYVMQDHLSRQKVDRTYKALFLENEYLKVTCLPELGGRLHSVFDKTQNKEMFHKSSVIKPGMIAMRGAWISGGVEWNSGPHGHTVTIVSPVNALAGTDKDGSGWLEISNTEQIFRTRWTVRVTLHPGRAYLDERIRIENPTDGMHPYYFWNCTAFPNRPGTRFIYPMTLGTDHNAREFFRWPVDKGRDLSWLKNYETYASVFAVNCTHDFFGAYDAEADRGIVQYANHNELGGKKAWTWGEWEFGKVAQKNLTDDDGPYIEVQSGPLPTQSDYGMLGPHDCVRWQEWWYPVHGLGDGFEYANRELAVNTSRKGGKLELRLLATAEQPKAVCTLARGRELVRKELDLSPRNPAVIALADEPERPVQVTVKNQKGEVLADYITPLWFAEVDPPDPAKFVEKPDDQKSVEELYLKGRAFHRGTERKRAREYYEKALARDSGHVASLRSLAVLDFEAGLYARAISKCEKALQRDGDDGLSWYYLGVSHLRLAAYFPPREGVKAGRKYLDEAMRCGYRASRCPGTAQLGHFLIGRSAARLGRPSEASAQLLAACGFSDSPPTAVTWLHLSYLLAHDDPPEMVTDIFNDSSLAARFGLKLKGVGLPAESAQQVRAGLGEKDFELLEASLAFADMGLFGKAGEILQTTCVDAVPPGERSFMPLYYLAWYAAKAGNQGAAEQWLRQAARTHKEKVFASRPEEEPILRFAIQENPSDAQAHFQLGCLRANLGRVEEAIPEWQKAAELDPRNSIAWRNLGLAAAWKDDLAKAEACYRKAIAARPSDQTLYRDLGEILLALNRRPEAIRLIETMPLAGMRRAEITMMLAQAYVDEKRWDDCIKLLESTPYFVNWEGQDVPWRRFNQAHIERGRQRLEKGDAQAALADFEAALTYPANLNVGRSNKPEESPAQFWRGKALAALGRAAEARSAWQAGAAGADVKGQQNDYRQKCREALGRPQ